MDNQCLNVYVLLTVYILYKSHAAQYIADIPPICAFCWALFALPDRYDTVA